MTTLFGTTAAIAGAIAAAIATAFVFAPRAGFETQVFIEASPETVWVLLTDPAEHQEWNPGMRRVKGRFVESERVHLTMGTPSGGEITFHPRVLVANPRRELRWLGRLGLPRLFDGEHYFLLAPEHGGTRLVQGERFCGVLLWVMDVQRFRADFERANEALKVRAEAQARRHAPALG